MRGTRATLFYTVVRAGFSRFLTVKLTKEENLERVTVPAEGRNSSTLILSIARHSDREYKTQPLSYQQSLICCIDPIDKHYPTEILADF